MSALLRKTMHIQVFALVFRSSSPLVSEAQRAFSGEMARQEESGIRSLHGRVCPISQPFQPIVVTEQIRLHLSGKDEMPCEIETELATVSRSRSEPAAHG